jgi:hypothetical protein
MKTHGQVLFVLFGFLLAMVSVTFYHSAHRELNVKTNWSVVEPLLSPSRIDGEWEGGGYLTGLPSTTARILSTLQTLTNH